MRPYDHAHRPIPVALGRAILILGMVQPVIVVIYLRRLPPWPLVVLPLAAFAWVYGVRRLRVWIEDSRLHWSHGIRMHAGSLDLRDVRELEKVPVHKIQPLGAYAIPGGTFYDSGSVEAVPVSTGDGRFVRFSSDEPEKLMAAIEAARPIA